MSPSPSKSEMMGKFEKYHVENALQDIQRAEVHKANPDLMKHVHKMAKNKIKEYRSIADLRQAANSLGNSDESTEPNAVDKGKKE